MSTLTIPLALMRDVATLLLPHASDDDITPVITTAALQQEDGKLWLIATDRYSVARYDLTGEAGVSLDGEPFLIPRDTMLWITRQLVTKNLLNQYGAASEFNKGGYRLEIHQHSDDDGKSPWVRVTLLRSGDSNISPEVEQLREFIGVRGNYPPAGRLFKEERTEVATVTLGADQLAKVVKNARQLNGRNGAVTWSFTPTENPNKPGPVYARLSRRFDLMIQPNAELR